MSTQAEDTAELRKARGAFFTPPEVASYMTSWAIRSGADTVLEPSCGEAAFLLPAVRRLMEFGAGPDLTHQVVGAELHAASARSAEAAVLRVGAQVAVREGDFLVSDPVPYFDAVIGNPPYVRYQEFSGESRAAAKRAALRAGVSLSNLASSWAAFTVHSALHVKQGGRLGLVLPAEILSVNYAAPVRDFIMREFQSVRLVLFTERVFPGVNEDVVLLLAEGRGAGPSSHCELLRTQNASTLTSLVESDVRNWVPRLGDRWSLALAQPDALSAYMDVMAMGSFELLEEWGDTTLGMVTGNNGFFTLTEEDVKGRGMTSRDVIPLSPPGSRHLRGHYSLAGLRSLGSAQATWLFRPSGNPSPAAQAYIREGEERGVHEAYKCRVRKPWWRVPYLPPADLLLTYMNADTPRLIANPSGAHHLNSVHGLYLREERRPARDLLAIATLNSVSLLGAELVGRSYGGGVLKIEPKEADVWPVPSLERVRCREARLREAASEVATLLADRRLFPAVEVVDAIILDDLDQELLAALRRGRNELHARREARSRST